MAQLLDDVGKPGWMKIGLRPRHARAIAAKTPGAPAAPALSDAVRIAARGLARMRVTTDASEEYLSVLPLSHAQASEEE